MNLNTSEYLAVAFFYKIRSNNIFPPKEKFKFQSDKRSYYITMNGEVGGDKLRWMRICLASVGPRIIEIDSLNS